MDNKESNANQQNSTTTNNQQIVNNVAASVQEQPTNQVTSANQGASAPINANKTVQPSQQEPQNDTKVLELPKLDQTVTTIGSLKKDKQKSPFAMLFLFVALIITIIFIPQITPYFSDLLTAININPNKEIYEGNTEKPTENDEKEEEEQETKYYPISDSTNITYEKINLSSISKKSTDNGQFISFILTNNDEKELNLQTKKYYLDLYDDSKTFLGSVLITNVAIPAKKAVTIDNVISSEVFVNATKLEVIERTYDDYQPIVLVGNMLSCQLNNRILVYTFVDSKLMAIDDKVSYTKTDDTKYTNDYLIAKSSIDKLDAIENVSAAIIQTTTGYNSSVIIDYQNLSVDMSTYDVAYYAKDTLAKNVKYEMISRGYTCQ